MLCCTVCHSNVIWLIFVTLLVVGAAQWSTKCTSENFVSLQHLICMSAVPLCFKMLRCFILNRCLLMIRNMRLNLKKKIYVCTPDSSDLPWMVHFCNFSLATANWRVKVRSNYTSIALRFCCRCIDYFLSPQLHRIPS